MNQDETHNPTDTPDEQAVAAHVRAACIQAAQSGYEEAAIAGLCGEGALEVAISSMQRLDLAALLADLHAGGNGDNDYRR